MSTLGAEAAPPERRRPTLTSKTLFVIGAMNMIDCINVNLLTPYVDEMVSDFLHSSPEDPQVGHIVGILIGLYSLCEVIFSIFWGAIADRFGRKPALLIGLAGSAIAPIMFGLGRSLPVVFIARAMDGVFCGNVGVARTYLGEICDSTNEAKAFGFLSLCFSMGLFIGPILGGQLVHPARWAPSVFGGTIFDTCPYLLPNLTYSIFAAISWVIGAVFLEESLPKEARGRSFRSSPAAADDDARQLRRSLSNTVTGTDPGGAPRSYPLAQGEAGAREVARRQCYPRVLLETGLVYVVLSGAVSATSQLFVLMVSYPADKGGFGFGPAQIGMVQNAAAAGLLLTQQLVYPRICKRLGFFRTFVFGWTLYATVWALFPVYSLFADTARYGSAPRYIALCLLQAFSACACGLCFPTSFVLINRASEGMDKGVVNGWSNSCGALVRALWPPLTAWMLGAGAASGLPDGVFLALHINLLLATLGLLRGSWGIRTAGRIEFGKPNGEAAAAAGAGEGSAPAAPRSDGAAPLIDG